MTSSCSYEDKLQDWINYKVGRQAYLEKWEFARDRWTASLIEAEEEINRRKGEIRTADKMIKELEELLKIENNTKRPRVTSSIRKRSKIS
jgi:hypothetical protein